LKSKFSIRYDFFRNINLFFKIINFLVFATLFYVFFLISKISLAGGYDEIGALVSHLELGDPRFADEYKRILYKIGFGSFIIDYFCMPLINFFIVPIRWTYALGITPIYGIIRLDVLSWEQTKLLLVLIHSLINIFSIHFISKIIAKEFKQEYTLFNIIFCSLIILSFTFLYWSISLTSYAMHLPAIALLVFYSTIDNTRPSLFSKKSIVLSLVILINYQYLPVILFFGLRDLFLNNKNFFTKQLYKIWILPFISSVLSVIFVLQRLILTSAKRQPQQNFDESGIFLIPYDNASIFELIEFFIISFINILGYLFHIPVTDNAFISSVSDEYFLFLVLILVFLVFAFFQQLSNLFTIKNQKSKLIYSIFLILSIQICMYLFNLLPMSPTRHSLIIFIPISILISVFLSKHFNKLNNKAVLVSLIFFLSVLLYRIHGLTLININQPNADAFKINQQCLNESQVEKVMIEDCQFLPLLENKKYTKLFIYSCGNFIPEMLSERKILFVSQNQENFFNTVAKYSSEDFVISEKETLAFNICLNKSYKVEDPDIFSIYNMPQK
jgi:hypothetical protein